MSGRIPKQFVEKLLSQIDIIDVVSSRIQLKKSGRNFTACCPFHQEKSPSFTVSPEKQFYHCFGCGANGNAIGFVIAFDGIDFPEAVERLAGMINMTVVRERTNEYAEKDNEEKKYFLINEQSLSFFQEKLESSEVAKSYLNSRGLNRFIIDKYELGYAVDNWSALSDRLVSSGWGSDFLVKSGVSVNKTSGNGIYDRFRNRIIFPIKNIKGKVIGFGGRVLDDKKPKYLNSPETMIFSKGKELYGLYEALSSNRNLKRLVVVEGYMDVLSLACSGFTSVVASLGTSINSNQISVIFKKVDEIVFCFDGDAAGRSAAIKSLDAAIPCVSSGKIAKFLFLENGEDPDSFVRARGIDDFEAMLDKSINLSDFIFELSSVGLELNSPESRAIFVSNSIKYIKNLPEGFFKDQFFSELSLRSNISVDKLHLSAAPVFSKGIFYDVSAKSEADIARTNNNFFSVSQIIADDKVNLLKKEILNLDRLIGVVLLQAPQLSLEINWPNISANESGIKMNFPSILQILSDNPGVSSSRLLGLLWSRQDISDEYKKDMQHDISNGHIGEGRLETLTGLMDRLCHLLDVELPLEQLISHSKTRALDEVEKQGLKHLLKKRNS